jgi:hypothetical protein
MKTILKKREKVYLAKASLVSAAKIINQLIVLIDNFDNSVLLGQCLQK